MFKSKGKFNYCAVLALAPSSETGYSIFDETENDSSELRDERNVAQNLIRLLRPPPI